MSEENRIDLAYLKALDIVDTMGVDIPFQGDIDYETLSDDSVRIWWFDLYCHYCFRYWNKDLWELHIVDELGNESHLYDDIDVKNYKIVR